MRLYDHPRMEQMNIYFLFNFLSFKQLMFLYNNNAIGYWTDITFFTSRSTDKVRSSLYVELMLHPMHAMDKDWFGVFLTSKWTNVLRQRLHGVFLFSARRRNIQLLG